jgi:hypothetical protein
VSGLLPPFIRFLCFLREAELTMGMADRLLSFEGPMLLPASCPSCAEPDRRARFVLRVVTSDGLKKQRGTTTAIRQRSLFLQNDSSLKPYSFWVQVDRPNFALQVLQFFPQVTSRPVQLLRLHRQHGRRTHGSRESRHHQRLEAAQRGTIVPPALQLLPAVLEGSP